MIRRVQMPGDGPHPADPAVQSGVVEFVECGAKGETSDVESKLGHSTHVCQRIGIHVGHKCYACGDTFQADEPTGNNHDLKLDPKPRETCTCSYCYYAQLAGDPTEDTSDVPETTDSVLYFVYRADSQLPLLAGWRDRDAALQYAKDSNASVVLGVNVMYRASAPFDTGRHDAQGPGCRR